VEAGLICIDQKYTKLGKELHSSYFEAWRHFFFQGKTNSICKCGAQRCVLRDKMIDTPDLIQTLSSLGELHDGVNPT